MSSKRIDAFDGLRFIVCLLVLASHCGVLKQGGFANRFFFVLCGYLCVRYSNEEVFFSVKEILHYYIKKIIRIIPSFYLILFAVHFFTGKFSGQGLIDNMFFFKSASVWWFLQHTMVFYCFVPFISILTAILKKLLLIKIKSSKAVCAILCVVYAAVTYYISKQPLFALYGNGGYIRFQLDMFLIGMSFRYFYEFIGSFKIKVPKAGTLLMDLTEIALIATFFLTSCEVLKFVNPAYKEFYIGWQHPYICAFISGVLIIVTALNEVGAVNKLLSNRFFAAGGKVSLLMYLSHSYMIPYITLENKYLVFLYLAVEAFSISYFIYEFYEKPLTAGMNRLADKVLK